MSISTGAAQRLEHRHGFRNRGEWILVDADLQHLLAIGDATYGATSPRGSLDHVARRALMPELRAAVETRTRVDRIIRMQGQPWRVQAVPLLGPATQTPIAVLGCYDSPDRAVPDLPTVGTWEFRIPSPGAGQELHVHVSPEIYAVHELPAAATLVAGPQLDDLVALADRPALRAFHRALVTEPVPQLRLCDFTGAPPVGDRYALRTAARRYDEATASWLRGITTRRRDEFRPPEPGHLDAVLALSRDPMWLIDPLYEVVYLASDSFGTYGLNRGATAHLPEMCHHEDLPAIRDYVRRAADTPGEVHPPVHVRFATVEGGWRQLDVQGTGVRMSPGETQVWCRISAVIR